MERQNVKAKLKLALVAYGFAGALIAFKLLMPFAHNFCS